MTEALHQHLVNTKSIDVLTRHPMVSVNRSTSLPDAFATLLSMGVLSLPVIDDLEPQTTVGFIDVFSLVVFALKINDEAVTPFPTYSALCGYHKFTSATVGEVLDSTSKFSYVRLSDSSNMWTAINAMIDFGQLHRVPISTDTEVLGVLSQSDVIKWALEFLETSPLGDRLVKDTSMGAPRDVIQIHKKKSVKEAFTLLKDKGVSGIAVISDFGDLYGNISATDVKVIGLDPNMFMRFNDTIEEFLKSVPENSTFGLNPIFIRPSDTVRVLARKFVDSGVHRIYLVGEMLKVLGVISMIDFMKFLIQEAEPPKTA